MAIQKTPCDYVIPLVKINTQLDLKERLITVYLQGSLYHLCLLMTCQVGMPIQ
jgi:hypothetical protein